MLQSTQQNQDGSFATQTAARTAIITALPLGIAAERLLWNGPFGPGWVLWIALFGTTAVVIVRQARYQWQTDTIVAAAIAVCVAAIPAWRASPPLTLLSFVALVAAASLPVLRAREFRFGATGVIPQLLGMATVAAHAAGGVIPLITSDAGHSTIRSRGMRVPLLAARGALFAVPPLIVFGALFVSADPVFEHYAQTIVRTIREEFLQHLVFVAAFCWISAGMLRALLPQRSPLSKLPAVPALPTAEMTITLSLVTMLFFAFVLVQARWLFGGAAALQAVPGLTVAEYARRGFFQLVVAAALVLPLLLIADAGAQTAAARRTTRILSGALVALVFVVMVSAMQRMTLYTQRFGLTEQRVYGTAFMGWLAVVFAWFVITTLRGRRRRFAVGPVIAGITSVFALAAANPDALITRVNMERAHAGAQVDGAYLAQLSADAAPEVLKHFGELAAPARCTIARRLLRQAADPYSWRTANLARVQAEQLVGQNRALLQAAAGDVKKNCVAPTS